MKKGKTSRNPAGALPKRDDALTPFRRGLRDGMQHIKQIFPINDNATGDIVGIVQMYEDSEKVVKIAHMEVFEEHRGKSHGRRVLNQICRCADDNGITLRLVPATGSKAIKQSDLEELYRSVGFMGNGSGMRREPLKRDHDYYESLQDNCTMAFDGHPPEEIAAKVVQAGRFARWSMSAWEYFAARWPNVYRLIDLPAGIEVHALSTANYKEKSKQAGVPDTGIPDQYLLAKLLYPDGADYAEIILNKDNITDEEAEVFRFFLHELLHILPVRGKPGRTALERLFKYYDARHPHLHREFKERMQELVAKKIAKKSYAADPIETMVEVVARGLRIEALGK